MPQGGVLTIQAQNAYLDEVFRRNNPYVTPGEYVQISVIDTGIGMDEATLQRIFEPFFTTREKGTGLGLAVVYGIVKQHEGYILVSSQPGRGTRCDIYFSYCKEPVVLEEVETVVESLPRGQETILMAEDEKEVGELLRTLLAGLGYKVFLAHDGEEALDLFSTRHQVIDLVILDAVMPKLSGPKVYDQMRAICPNLPCLFLTGYSEEIVQRYFEQGIEIPMLRKPVTFHEFGSKVREILDQATRSFHYSETFQEIL
jgi:CheY-like chemotaxis protein